MATLPQIFLGDLQLHHIRRLLNLVEDWTIGFARLEVQRPIFGLQDDIIAEQSVQRLKFRNSLFYTILTLVIGTIYKTTPHHNTIKWFQGISQHVGSIGMCTVVVARTRLPFTIGFH